MNNPPPSKCINCGAGLVPAGENLLKCSYCGSIVSLNTVTHEAPKPEPAPQQDQDTAANKPQPQTEPTENEPGSGGCAVVFVIFAILLVFILIGIKNHHAGSGNNAIADSIDAAKEQHTRLADSLSRDSIKNDKIKKLSQINVDTIAFKKLYKAARKDPAASPSTGIFISDERSTYEYGNSNGIQLSIYKNDPERSLRFNIFYTADELLHIQSVTFVVDGKKYQYKPSFSAEDNTYTVWERSDEVINNADLPMLVDIANSKKAEIRYNGKKHSFVMTIPQLQKAGIKRELKIYKGFLMEYDQ